MDLPMIQAISRKQTVSDLWADSWSSDNVAEDEVYDTDRDITRALTVAFFAQSVDSARNRDEGEVSSERARLSWILGSDGFSGAVQGSMWQSEFDVSSDIGWQRNSTIVVIAAGR
jgi:hypothetical protein